MSSILTMGRNRQGNGTREPAVAAPTYPPRPAPRPPGPPDPHVLGTVTLANVDQLAAMSADEIERVADQVIEAAHDTANVLREAARRVRHSGLVANERLANFVRVASTCTDAARLMSASVEQRDEPQPEPEPPAAVAAEPDLDALEAEVNGDRAGAT